MIEVGPLRVSIKDGSVFRAGQRCQISSRAFAVLEALISSRGSVVTKEALLNHAWPSTIVEENNLQVQIVTLRRALGDARDLLQTVPGRGYLLLPQPQAAPRQSKVYSLGLPFVDTLFGRRDAVDDLLHLFKSNQVVTLTGAGGIGKTSLAIEACRDTGDLFICIRYISLAAIQNDHQLKEAVLSIFADVVTGTATSVEEMSRSLRKSQCLVILDNCEHLIESAAYIAQTITAGNPSVRVLATSREALRIGAETVYPVQNLACPPLTAKKDETLESDAVKLFLHRLNRLSAEFDLDETTVALIAEICRRLDGIPLAIELAAARAATLGLDTVRAHLDDRFAILTGGSRDALPRHQTLRAVFDWSYRLLAKDEQQLFRQAGVFADGFTLEAIAAIMKRHGQSTAGTARTVAGLVAKSLLYVDRQNARRFRQLESSRAFSRSLLDQHGETDEAAHAHATYFRDFFERGPYKEEQIPIESAHDVISAEIGNMRAAMAWAFGPGGSPDLGIDLAGTAVPMLYELPRLDECEYWSVVAIDALRTSKGNRRQGQTRLRILTAYAAALVYTEGPSPSVETAWQEVLALAEAANDHGLQLRAIWGLWNLELYAGRPVSALARAQRFQRAAQTFGSPLQVALSRRVIGMTLHYAGRHAEAREELLAALAAPAIQEVRWSTAGVRTDMVTATHALLARIQWFLGDPGASLQQIEAAEDTARATGHEVTLAYVLMEATIPLAILHRNANSLMLAVESLENECRKAGLRAWLACCDAFEWIARAMESRLTHDALAEMERSIERLCSTGYLTPLPMVLGEFASALLASGQHDRAIETVGSALEHCAQHGSRWYHPALQDLRASITDQLPVVPGTESL
ncbi:winged helix-turn-helix domain-containing protein [Paraburkholderia bannensis]|uniref:winged helix-turn-helix domain-containing protein n=1 Tax=Paraburkholderia bannensis TaxID=765414 RepID=UPI002ABDFE52|nr:winged helix-turn-helix domain-containing protein [Paraburkholderia bannensis]